jgi:four helix bundle protein
MYKFENLEVWKLSLDYSDMIYDIANKLPESERYNLSSQIIRAATSISLNIAEGSTGQSDPKQKRFLGMALRSLVETIACLRLIERREYAGKELIDKINQTSEELFAKLTAFRNALGKKP